MTKSTITRERLEEIVSDPMINQGSEFAMMARMALAAMDSEPVAEVYQAPNVGICAALGPSIRMLCPLEPGTKLYRHAQPAPVVPEEKPIPNTLSMYAVDAVAAIAEVKGWNACRAAMLDAEPVTMANKLPDDFDFDRFNDVTWLECVASNPHMHSPTTSTIARVALELNKRIGAGNSPAQSDCCPAQNHVSPEQNGDTPAQSQGWIQVSERMPPSRHEVLVGRWWGEKPLWCCKWATYIPGHPDAQSSGWLIPGASWTPTHWMPLPAAPQEVKSE